MPNISVFIAAEPRASGTGADIDRYRCLLEKPVEDILKATQGNFPRIYEDMLTSEEFGGGASHGMLAADKRSQAVKCVVETTLSQINLSVLSDRVRKTMDVHMDSIEQQVQRGVEDMFLFAEQGFATEESRPDIRAHSFPFKLQGIMQHGMPGFQHVFSM